jgi:protein-disulfide isomerase
MLRFRVPFCTTLALALFAAPVAARAQSPGKSATRTPPSPARSDPRVLRADMSRIAGSGGATLWILVASDFQCPVCKQYHDRVARQVEKEFVSSGVVRMAYINFPLSIHKNAMPAAEAAMCAGAQDKFWPYHDRLFATQGRWSDVADPTAMFTTLARELKLDTAAWSACMKDDTMIPMIRADHQRAKTAGVSSTPSFLVGDMLLPGLVDMDVIRMAVREALGKPK